MIGITSYTRSGRSEVSPGDRWRFSNRRWLRELDDHGLRTGVRMAGGGSAIGPCLRARLLASGCDCAAPNKLRSRELEASSLASNTNPPTFTPTNSPRPQKAVERRSRIPLFAYRLRPSSINAMPRTLHTALIGATNVLGVCESGVAGSLLPGRYQSSGATVLAYRWCRLGRANGGRDQRSDAGCRQFRNAESARVAIKREQELPT